MTIEREAKLTAPTQVQLPNFDGVVDDVSVASLAERHLDAVYYDTAQLDLEMCIRDSARDDFNSWRFLGLNHPQMPHLRHGREQSSDDDTPALIRHRTRAGEPSDSPSPRARDP